MGKHLKITAPEVKIQEPVKVVFGFAELRQCSYVNATNDGKFFIRFIERLKKSLHSDMESGLHVFQTFIWNIDNYEREPKSLHTTVMSFRRGQITYSACHRRQSLFSRLPLR